MSSRYHHGDLPAALRAAAVELIAETGPSGFSLREVARRAGVSHAAPAHHFGDRRGLLTSVAAEGFTVLSKAMREATEGVDDPRERLIAGGRAYVTTALENPGHYAVMVTHEYTDEDEVKLMECSLESYAILLEMVELLRDRLNPELDVDATATLIWCGVHGLVEIAPVLDQVAEKNGTEFSSVDKLIEQYADMVMHGVSAA